MIRYFFIILTLLINIQIFTTPLYGMQEGDLTGVSKAPLLQSMKLPELDERDDPPFFCLDHPDRKIYVRGSFHTLPLRFCFVPPVFEEFERISASRPILYTEHESSNAQALELLKDPKNKLDPEMLKVNINLFSCLGLPEEEALPFRESFRDEPILLNRAQASTTLIGECFEAELWLAAPLLGVQANLLSYLTFGGLESDLVELSPWKESWYKQRYLESNLQALTMLKGSERKDYDKNREWVIRSIRSIMEITKTEVTLLEKIHEVAFQRMLKGYSWRVISRHNPRDLPESAIERNKLWAQEILKTLKAEKSTCPIVIVLGTGHLAGMQSSISFISFFNSQLKAPLMRINNKGEWVRVE